MKVSFNTLRRFVIAAALALPALSATAAQAQSVKGSGTASGFDITFAFHVAVYVHGNRLGGSVQLTTYASTTTKDIYYVEDLIIQGGQALVSARSKSDGLLYGFLFIDSRDLNGESDYFGFSGYPPVLPLTSGDVTVTP